MNSEGLYDLLLLPRRTTCVVKGSLRMKKYVRNVTHVMCYSV